jgi:MFS superfamily sulfate permease-like transporter
LPVRQTPLRGIVEGFLIACFSLKGSHSAIGIPFLAVAGIPLPFGAGLVI